MANSALALVEFHGVSLYTTIINSVPFVALRQICESIGLQWEGQLQRIKRHAVLSTCVCVTHTQMPGDDQSREVVMLPLDKLNGWLFGVSVNRVKPELRPKLIQYQSECFDVLAGHFGAVKPPVSTLTGPSLKTLKLMVITTEDGKSTVEMYPASDLPQMVLHMRDVISTDEAQKIASHANLRMMGDIGRMGRDEAWEDFQKAARKLPAHRLHTLAHDLWMELGLRTILTNDLMTA